MKTKKAKTTPISDKLISELRLMVKVGATPIECVKSLAGKISRSTVYKLYNKIKTEADSELKEASEEFKAVNVPNEVTEDKCLECDTESAHIINELSAKNEELKKELHTSKNVIVTLQKMTTELNEAITESKCMIHEICKERDDKEEDIRVLNLELQRYKNDIKIVIEDREYLEGLLSNNANETGSIADFRKIIEEMIQLYIKKNKDYGDAFKQSYNEFGNAMCAIRINDKLNRFKTLIKQNNEVKTESIKDTLIDLANYAVMTIIEIEQEVK